MLHSLKVIELIMFFIEEHLRKTSLGMHYFQVEVLWLCLRTTWSSFKYPNRRSCFISSSAGFEAISWVNSSAEDLLYLQSYKTKRSGDFFIFFERAQGLLCGYSFSPSTCLLMKLLWLHQWFYVISQTHLIENWKLWMELKVLDRY